ncbi:MAG: hypothetical protein ORN85_02555 [Sediminibacterium sp.]|nr:hypothetical protein [Sediminibacterium sp.]
MKPSLAYIALTSLIFLRATVGFPQIKSISLIAGLGSANSKFKSNSFNFDETEAYLGRTGLKPSSFTVSLLTELAFFNSKDLLIQTGVNYSEFGKGDPFVQDAYFTSSGSKRSVSYRQDYSWVGLPLNLYYQLNSKKIKPFITGGLILNYFLNNSVIKENSYFYDANNNLTSYIESSIAVRRTNVQLWNTLGIGINCVFSNMPNLGIILQTQFVNQLTPNWNNTIDEKLKWLNFSLGIKYFIDKD